MLVLARKYRWANQSISQQLPLKQLKTCQDFDTNWKHLVSQQEEVVPGVENLQVLNLANVPSLGQGPSEA